MVIARRRPTEFVRNNSIYQCLSLDAGPFFQKYRIANEWWFQVWREHTAGFSRHLLLFKISAVIVIFWMLNSEKTLLNLLFSLVLFTVTWSTLISASRIQKLHNFCCRFMLIFVNLIMVSMVSCTSVWGKAVFTGTTPSRFVGIVVITLN